MSKKIEKAEYDKMLINIVSKEKRTIETIQNSKKKNAEGNLEDDENSNKLMIYNEMEKILQDKIEKLQ